MPPPPPLFTPYNYFLYGVNRPPGRENAARRPDPGGDPPIDTRQERA